MDNTLQEKKVSFIPQMGLLLLLTLVFIGSALLTMFFPLKANIPINIIFPLVILVALKMVFFERLKLSTLILMRLLVVVTVLGLVSGELCIIIVLVLLGINIMEAALTDLKKKNYFNAASGLALAATLPLMSGSWNGIYYQIFAPGVTAWIIAYTLWNWIFVTYEFSPSISKMHLGTLAAPLIGSLILMNPAVWFILRGNSLTMTGVIQIAQKERWEKLLAGPRLTAFIENFHTKPVQIALMVVNLALVGVMVYLKISS